MNKKRILVIEDEIVVAERIRDTLLELGYNVPAIVASGQEAVSQATALRPDLVLMDIQLQGKMNGVQAAEHVRARLDIPVIYLTAYADADTLKQARVSQPFGYILKPFRPDELHTAIEMALYKYDTDRQLRQSEERYRAVVENAHDGILIADDRYRLIYVNDQLCQLMGYSRQEIIGQDFRKFLDEEARCLVADRYIRRQRGETVPPRYEFDLLRKDGQIRRIEISAAVIQDPKNRTIAHLRDITEQVRAQEIIEQQNAFLRTIIDSLTYPFYVVNVDDYRVQIANRTIAENTTPPLHCYALLHAFTRPCGDQDHPCPLEIVKKTRRPAVVEHVHHSPNSPPIHVEVHAHPIFDAQGDVVQVIEYALDITERKRAEVEREKLIEELKAFAHTVAHDLKNPLSQIIGFANVLCRDYNNMASQEIQDSLQTIAHSGLKMNNIIEELLLLAGVRQKQVEQVPLDMASIVTEVQKRLSGLIEKSQTEIIVPPPTSWPVALGHPPWIEEVWMNYLSNAIKYGGRPPRVELGATEQADDQVRFWVRDNGPGLSPQECSRLFVAFERLGQTRAQGYGLGLSIVHRIVEKLGGQIGVQSQGRPGQGSLFYFTLPTPSQESQDAA